MEMNRISDELLREAVKQACEREGAYYEEFTKDAEHHFSIRHRIRMRRLYRKMKRKKAEEPVDRYKVYTYPMTEDDDDRRQFVSTPEVIFDSRSSDGRYEYDSICNRADS